MSLLLKLTLRHLSLNRRRTLITIIGIVLSVAMVTTVSGLVVSFQDLLYQDSVLRYGLWHVRYDQLDAQTAAAVIQEPVFGEYSMEDTPGGITLTLLFNRLHKGIFEESEAVCHKLGIGQDQVVYQRDLLIAAGILPGPYYRAVYSFAAILLVLVAVGSVLVISNAFTISADQRMRQFGMLKSMGATNGQVRSLVVWEGLLLGAVAIPVGLLAGFGIQAVALFILNRVFAFLAAVSFLVGFRLIVSPLALTVTVLASLLVILASAWRPARLAARTSPIDAIRQSRSFRLTRRQVRVPSFVGRLFGFEGLLAAKTMGRNRGKYRAAVLSLVVSIVLFLGVSSFGSTLVKATDMVYTSYGSNVVLQLYGNQTVQDSLAEQLRAWPDAAYYPSRQAHLSTSLPQGFATANFTAYFGEPDEMGLVLASLSNEDFSALCRSLRLDDSAFADPTGPAGILVNTTGVHIAQGGRRVSFSPYHFQKGRELPLLGKDTGDASLTLLGAIEELPSALLPFYHPSSVWVIVPEATRLAWDDGSSMPCLNLAVDARDAYGFSAWAEQALEQAEADFNLFNYEQAAATNRQFSYLVMTFVYSFIAMLTLIGITSVVTTVSTSISLRRRELAMLRSSGMTEQGMVRMLLYESLLYGLKALAIGLPVGVLVSVLLHRAMGTVMTFAYSLPLGSMLISTAGVFLLTMATMAHARRQQQQESLVEALRLET